MLPSDNATNTIGFPRNANRAVISVSACGQAAEEFWWGNALQSNTRTFENETGTLYGYSPFREVQVLIDGQLAGVQWPFPIIFTGGVVPGLWRPIVGIDAFDLREHEIDVTPWLPTLSDGEQHTFEVRVVGIEDDGKTAGALSKTIGNSWYVTGKIFVWLDEDSSSVTTGRAPTILLPQPVITLSQEVTKDKIGANETLEYTTDVKRILSISTLLTTQSGTRLVTWTQSLSFTNYGKFTAFGATQQSEQNTNGIDQSTGAVYYKSSYTYPLSVNTSFSFDNQDGNFSIDATLLLGLNINAQGTPIHPTSRTPYKSTSLSTTQNGTAQYFASPKARLSTSFGSTSQEYISSVEDSTGKPNTVYYRDVKAENSTVVTDHEIIHGIASKPYSLAAGQVNDSDILMSVSATGCSPRELLGRGPGNVRKVLVQGGQ